jgi:HAMP domain-containing protein
MKIWQTLKSWGLAIAGVLLVVLGAGWLWRRKQSELGRVRDELAAKEALTEVRRLEALREEVARQVGEKDVAIEAIDGLLAENQRKLVEAHDGGQGLSDDEVSRLFGRLGY